MRESARLRMLEAWPERGILRKLPGDQEKLDQISRVQGRHTRALNQHGKMLTGLKSDARTRKGDVAELKTDMVEVKGALAEILNRLSPKGE